MQLIAENQKQSSVHDLMKVSGISYSSPNIISAATEMLDECISQELALVQHLTCETNSSAAKLRWFSEGGSKISIYDGVPMIIS